MASVYELRGTSFDSFSVGKKGPLIAKTNIRDMTISAVSSSTLLGGDINIIGGDGTSGGNISLKGGGHPGGGVVGGVELSPSGVNAGETTDLRFVELVANGANFVGFKAPDAIVANQIWTLPGTDGNAGDTLVTDGGGITSWVGGSIFEIYSGVAQVLSATATVVNLSNIRIPNTNFTVAGGIVTIQRAGLFSINFSVSTDSTNSNRTGAISQLFINGVAYASSAAYTYNRTTSVGENTAGRSVLSQFSIGDTIEIRSTRIAGSGITTIANESNLLLEWKGP